MKVADVMTQSVNNIALAAYGLLTAYRDHYRGRLAAPDGNWHGFAISRWCWPLSGAGRLARDCVCAYHWRNYDRECRFRNIDC
jgi:hypothetical protein